MKKRPVRERVDVGDVCDGVGLGRRCLLRWIPHVDEWQVLRLLLLWIQGWIPQFLHWSIVGREGPPDPRPLTRTSEKVCPAFILSMSAKSGGKG